MPRACREGKHAPPLRVGGAGLREWAADDKEYEFWNTLSSGQRTKAAHQQYVGCFLCKLDEQMSMS